MKRQRRITPAQRFMMHPPEKMGIDETIDFFASPFKSLSAEYAAADPETKAKIAEAFRTVVDKQLAFLEEKFAKG